MKRNKCGKIKRNRHSRKESLNSKSHLTFTATFLRTTHIM